METAGAEFAAAAALLGENQILTENPAALSMIACGLANAGRELSETTSIISDDAEEWWMRDGDVAMVLSGAAGDLASAAAAMGPTSVADAENFIVDAADALEDAGVAIETGGCGCGGDGGDDVVMKHLRHGGEALKIAARAVGQAAEGMKAAAARDSPSAKAAGHLAVACRALSSAGSALIVTKE